VEGTPTQPLMTFPLTCILGDTLFTYSFLVLPNCPTPLLGRDIFNKISGHSHLTPISIKAMTHQPLISILTVPPHHHRCLASTSFSQLLALTATLVDPIVWDLKNPSVASYHEPDVITLKEPSTFPNQSQYHISLTHLRD
jgi:hypothetical protein